MKVYEIWTEGYAATGQYGGASYHGSFAANSFKEAVRKYKESCSEEEQRFFNKKLTNYWGYKFFDNESSARASFG